MNSRTPNPVRNAGVPGGITRRELLKAAGGLGLLTLGYPLVTSCSKDSPLDYSRTIREMTAQIERQMAQDAITGAAIALVDDQQVVWSRGFGYADVRDRVLVTSDTVFGIGSTSKTFTAAMVMQLVEQGLVKLDDPLSTYIPHFSIGPPLGPYPAPSGPITIRTILTQHSGIPGELTNGLFTTVPHRDFNARMVNYLQNEHAQYPTDLFFAYSNTAVAFLADVIAAASGMPFMAYAKAFLQSLGMHRSSFDRDDPSVAVGQTKTYYNGQEYFDGYINSPATGAMLSSVSDMARYIRMILAGGVTPEGRRILRPDTVEAMLTPKNTSVALDFDFRIGYIWWLCDPDLSYTGHLCQHGGTTTMTKTSLKILLDHRLGVIILTNSNTAGAMRDAVPTKTLQLALEEKTGLTPPSVVQASPALSLIRDRLEDMTGIYIPTSATADTPAGVKGGKGYDRISGSGSNLAWIQDAGSSSPVTQILVPLANGRYSPADSREIEYEFRAVSGFDVIISHHRGFANLKAVRYSPAAVPAAWAARQGTYGVANLDADDINRTFPDSSEDGLTMQVVLKDGMLLKDNQPIAPVSDTGAYLPGLARDLGTALAIVTVNGEELIQHSRFLYRRR
jgi:CubicO group peptidase (beta-lactamase class C family)